MLSKKSKIEGLRKSRKGLVLVVSVAASLCRACRKVCDRFAAIRCGPSRCPAWDPPVGLENFSTASTESRNGKPESEFRKKLLTVFDMQLEAGETHLLPSLE
jgi:hypothetical protein